MQKLYKGNLDPTLAAFGFNAPLVEYVNKSLIYGLFLSDHSILLELEAQLVILTCIMCAGYRSPTLWHLRGTRRLGVSEEDVEKVQKAVELVAEIAGKSTEGWPRVQDVRNEV